MCIRFWSGERLWAAVVVACLSSCCAFAAGDVDKQEVLREKSLSVLHEAVERGEEWVKVHAAESLIWTGHAEGVREMFLREEPGAAPKYRIGVWRVLAQCASDAESRDAYVGKIVAAFLEREGPDRLHAAETLGKLAYAGDDPEFARVCAEGTGSFRSCACWILANGGGEAEESAVAALLDNADDADARGMAAYALRFRPSVRPATCVKLKEAAEREPVDSKWRVDVLSAAYVHADAADARGLRERLLPYLTNGDSGEKREVCAALGRRPDRADLPVLASLLDDPDLDARAGAAEAILRIESAVPHRE